MGFWTAIVIIVAVWGIVAIVRARHSIGNENFRETFGGDSDQSQREAELQREVEELRERIQVLERIATESGDTTRLAAEIEKLRDK
jgi:glutamine synthetase adenylyltransferase